MKKIAFFLLLVFLYGCIHVVQDLNDQKLTGVSLEMSKQDVIRNIGEPTEKKTVLMKGQEYEVWKYPIERLWLKRFNKLDKSYYQIFFLDGKVSHWDRIKVYAQPTYDYSEPDPSGKGGVTVEVLTK